MTAAAAAIAGLIEVRARARALPAVEVAVRRRGAALAGRDRCRRSCRRTSSSPASRHSKPASRKTRSRPSASACRLTRPRARHDPSPDTVATLRPRDDRRRGAQVFDAPVGARADEHAIDRDAPRAACRARAPCSRARAACVAPLAHRRARRIGHAPRRSAAPPRGSCPRSPSARARPRRGAPRGRSARAGSLGSARQCASASSQPRPAARYGRPAR